MPSISAALHDLLGGTGLSVEDALAKHVVDDYRQSTDGTWIDRAAFALQLGQLRAFIAHVDIEVRAELSTGSSYAERHLITVTGRDGSTRRQEVYLFAEIAADGRFARLEELTRALPDG